MSMKTTRPFLYIFLSCALDSSDLTNPSQQASNYVPVAETVVEQNSILSANVGDRSFE